MEKFEKKGWKTSPFLGLILGIPKNITSCRSIRKLLSHKELLWRILQTFDSFSLKCFILYLNTTFWPVLCQVMWICQKRKWQSNILSGLKKIHSLCLVHQTCIENCQFARQLAICQDNIFWHILIGQHRNGQKWYVCLDCCKNKSKSYP